MLVDPLEEHVVQTHDRELEACEEDEPHEVLRGSDAEQALAAPGRKDALQHEDGDDEAPEPRREEDLPPAPEHESGGMRDLALVQMRRHHGGGVDHGAADHRDDGDEAEHPAPREELSSAFGGTTASSRLWPHDHCSGIARGLSRVVGISSLPVLLVVLVWPL